MTIFTQITASRAVSRGVAILAARTAYHCRLEAYATRSRRAFTLVEMLVGMAITLVMMAAVVNLFANISEGVRNRRATMEVSANLRIARSQLFNDLAGATCLKYPKNTHAVMPKPDSNNPPDGYFEIVEGEYSDDNPSPFLDGNSANGELEYGVSLVPSGGDPQTVVPAYSSRTPVNGDVTNGGGLGDYDDILAMTVENEADKFRGKGRGLRPGGDPRNIGTAANNYSDGDWIDIAISSPVAEVIWFAVENPSDRSQGEPGMRKVYRRTLLVAPWYGTETKIIGGTPVTGSDPLLDLNALGITTYADQVRALRQFQGRYDLSVRLENGRIVPNTLADLARRGNRFGHLPDDLVSAPSAYKYPHPFPHNTATLLPSDSPKAGVVESSLQTLANEEYTLGYASTAYQTLFQDTAEERGGGDLILNEVLGFDVQVFDPGAPLYQYQGSIVQPSGTPNSAFLNANSSGTATLTGFGTYVDLGWNNGTFNTTTGIFEPEYDYTAITAAPPTLFQQERRLGWHPVFPNPELRGTPAVYDTWTTYYETDQINQEESPFYTQPQSTVPWTTNQIDVVDQGANGLDDIVTPQELAPPPPLPPRALNGPDDPLERETSPPYPSPLYGVQVKLRVYEPESRQIRETTVTRNLAK